MAELTPDTVHTLATGRIERIWGPPGTGKSTTLKDRIKHYVTEHGPDAVAVTSFTVTAAKSIARMDLPLPDHAVGTLHSLALRALGHCDVAVDAKVIKDWNSRVGFDWRITPDSRGHSETAAFGSRDTGDGLLSAYDMCRAQLMPPEAMPADVRRFATAWDSWKHEVDAVDYTDMIYHALRRALDGEKAPGNPRVLISDEAQDMTPLETALLLAWGAPETIFALDDDQAINEWRGGDAGPILRLEDSDHAQIIDTPLTQSHRIPAAVHMVAQTWIEACSFRRDKEYRPRDCDGRAYAVGFPIEHPAVAQQIAKDVDAGRSVMVIASCEYMLRPLVANLRKLGVPYANRYRPAEARWNPLYSASGMTIAERLYRYLVLDETALGDASRLWTGDDVRAWLELVGVKEARLVRGAKAKAKNFPAGELDVAQVIGMFTDETAFEDATEPSLGWLLNAARGIKGMTEKLAYPAQLAQRFGPAALVDEPLVTTGTVHSVKGAQADVVYLSPSLSPAGHAERMRSQRGADAARRLMYVGMTRAKETLVVLSSTEACVHPNELVPPEMSVR